MKNRKRMLVVLVVLLGLVIAVQPVAGQPPHAMTVSGHSCSYLVEAGDEKMTGQNYHAKGHILYTVYESDNDSVLPSGYSTSVVNINTNFKTQTIKFHRTMIKYPDGAEGTFEGVSSGFARFIYMATGELAGVPNVSGVLHGTGEYEGLTMKLTFVPGDPNRCPEEPWDTALFWGYIVPSGE